LIRRINSKWEQVKVLFDQEDYGNLAEAYWASFDHRLLPIELTRDQTSALVEACRANGVTVNTALTAAFIGAQYLVQGDKPYHSSIAVAASLRNRLREPAGEGMGFYAGIVRPNFRYDIKTGFWENAGKLHKKLTPLFTTKNLFSDFIAWCYLEPTILEAINFKKLGGLVAPHQSKHQKLSAFGSRDDVVLALLKRDKQESLDRKFMGTAVTNLTRMGFPESYGALELDRLFMHPGGAFPLVNVNLVLGAVTCSGRLSLVLEYAEQAVDTQTMERVRDQAMAFLLDTQESFKNRFAV
jgi:hypothetical protein